MTRHTLTIILSAVVLLATLPVSALATSGCVDSPEEPTVALGLIGLAVSARAYFKARAARK
jgi:hypothetical protein